MGFFTTSVTGLKTVVTAIGAGVGVWGVINLLEGYGNDNPGANCSYTVKKQQHKLRTAYPTILYQSGAVTRKCCCSIFMPLK